MAIFRSCTLTDPLNSGETLPQVLFLWFSGLNELRTSCGDREINFWAMTEYIFLSLGLGATERQ